MLHFFMLFVLLPVCTVQGPFIFQFCGVISKTTKISQKFITGSDFYLLPIFLLCRGYLTFLLDICHYKSAPCPMSHVPRRIFKMTIWINHLTFEVKMNWAENDRWLQSCCNELVHRFNKKIYSDTMMGRQRKKINKFINFKLIKN